MKLSKLTVLGLVLLCIECYGNPKGGRAVAGTASIESLSPEVLEIVAGKQAILEWSEFSIQPGETTRFIQPDSHSSVLNRVVADLPSQIFGSLEANGKVYLLNPNGILVGESGMVNTGSFIASTLDVLNEDFLKNGELLFKGDSIASIVHLGSIRALDGDVALVGRFVENKGRIDAPNGTAGIAAAGEVLLRPGEGELLWIRPEMEYLGGTGLAHEGTIEALQVELKSEGNAYALAIQHKGSAQANRFESRGGKIFLVAEKGTAEVSGSLKAEQGEARILAESIYLKDQASIDVSGDFGGGTVLIGGDERGTNPDLIPQARELYADGLTSVKANALREGAGGKVIAWATDVTSYLGQIEAKGGALSGDGGFVEVSSPGKLGFLAKVDTTAPCGKIGMLLLDPSQIDITGATSGVALGNCGFSASTYASTLSMGTLDVAALQAQLMSTTTTITTFDGTCMGLTGDGSITLSSPLTILALSTGDLILSAQGDININAAIVNNSDTSIEMTAGTGASTGAISINAPISFTGPTGHLYLTANTSTAAGIQILADVSTIGSGGLLLATDRNIHITRAVAVAGPIDIHGLAAMNPCGLLFIDANNNPNGVFASLTNSQIASSSTIRADAITVEGSTTNTMARAVLETNGPFNVFVTHDLNVTGGNGLVALATMGSIGAGSQLILSAENITIQGGTGSSALAEIQGQGPMQVTTIANGMTPSGNLKILGGTGAGAFFGGGAAPANLAIGGDLTLTGNGPNGFAFLTAGGAGPSTITFNGELLANGTGTVEIACTNDLSIVGNGTYTQGANPGRISLTPGTDGAVVFLIDGTATLSIDIPENLIISGGGGAPAFPVSGIFGPQTMGFHAFLDLTRIGGDVILTGGASAGYVVGIGSLQLAGFGAGDTTLALTAHGSQGVALTGGSANGAATLIGTMAGTMATPVTVAAPNGSIALNTLGGFMNADAGIVTNGGFLDISAGNNLSLTGTLNNLASFSVLGGTNSVQAIAGNSISLGDYSLITSTQDIVLVTDNNNPSPPAIGSSTFATSALSGIDANSGNGNLQIFTTIPSLVTINGTLNGAAFVQGPLGVDTPQEHYMVYYPDAFVDPMPPHFTVFYKGLAIPPPPSPTPSPPTPGTIVQSVAFYNTAQRGMQEFLDDLQAYLDFDFFNFSELFFTAFFPADFLKGISTPESVKQVKIFRREYTNYNLRRINLLK